MPTKHATRLINKHTNKSISADSIRVTCCGVVIFNRHRKIKTQCLLAQQLLYDLTSDCELVQKSEVWQSQSGFRSVQPEWISRRLCLVVMLSLVNDRIFCRLCWLAIGDTPTKLGALRVSGRRIDEAQWAVFNPPPARNAR